MDTADENFHRIRMIDLLAFFIENIYWYSHSLARSFAMATRRFFENPQLGELVDMTSDLFSQHPLLKYVALATTLVCAIPVLMFIVFGLVSVAITFTGFLFIEGTLLVIGGLTMFCSIVTLILVMTVMAATLGVLYLLALKLGIILNRFETTSTLLRNLAPSYVERQGFRHSAPIADTHQD